MPQGFHARIIKPYGGQIGPKLGSSCPPGDDAQALQVVSVRHLVPRSQGEMVPGLFGAPEVIRLFSRPIRNVKSTSRWATAPLDDLNSPITGLRSDTLNLAMSQSRGERYRTRRTKLRISNPSEPASLRLIAVSNREHNRWQISTWLRPMSRQSSGLKLKLCLPSHPPRRGRRPYLEPMLTGRRQALLVCALPTCNLNIRRELRRSKIINLQNIDSM